jgi:hypothetical protein
MLETTVIPLSSLPTAHPSPEAARTLGTVVRRPTLPTTRPSTGIAPRFAATTAATARVALA